MLLLCEVLFCFHTPAAAKVTGGPCKVNEDNIYNERLSVPIHFHLLKTRKDEVEDSLPISTAIECWTSILGSEILLTINSIR